ncbi:hypothetical protein [Frankia gtarii]|nr:hypothetical protein [Frankia gtarii]
MPDGSIRTWAMISSADGSMMGDGTEIVRPGDERYDKLDAWLRSRGR